MLWEGAMPPIVGGGLAGDLCQSWDLEQPFWLPLRFGGMAPSHRHGPLQSMLLCVLPTHRVCHYNAGAIYRPAWNHFHHTRHPPPVNRRKWRF